MYGGSGIHWLFSAPKRMAFTFESKGAWNVVKCKSHLLRTRLRPFYLFIYLLFYLIADRYFGPVKTSSVWWLTEYASRISWVAWVAHRVGSCHIFTSISRSPFLQFLCWRSRVLPLCRPWFIKLQYDLCCVLRGITRSRNAYVFSILFRGANAAPEASRARIRFPSYK